MSVDLRATLEGACETGNEIEKAAARRDLTPQERRKVRDLQARAAANIASIERLIREQEQRT